MSLAQWLRNPGLQEATPKGWLGDAEATRLGSQEGQGWIAAGVGHLWTSEKLLTQGDEQKGTQNCVLSCVTVNCVQLRAETSRSS